MADPHPNALLIRAFHECQNRFYAGGDQAPVRAMLAEDVVWHVPGDSAIAGEHRGRDAVLRHFANRRELAAATFRIDVRGVLADDRRAVILAAGEVEVRGERYAWGTVGIFRFAGGQIAECWVVPYDQDAFDEIWSPGGLELGGDANEGGFDD
jgi:ketosteroid isomerase-like protein